MEEEPGAAVLGIVCEFGVETQMRDGTILRSSVFRPDGPGRYPALLARSPYGTVREGHERMVRAGYVVVAQDVRGRYASDGDFEVFSDQDHDGEDGVDTIDWMIQQPWCNGRIGMFGDSYVGYTVWQTARIGHPNLLAISARTIPRDLWEVDFNGGIFQPGRRVHWWFNSIAPDIRRRIGWPGPHTSDAAREVWTQVEQSRWLGFMPWAEIVDFLPPLLAERVREWFERPGAPVWRFGEMYDKIKVPNLDVSGWYDHCNGSIEHLAGLQQSGGSSSARRHSQLICGPWNHPQRGARKLGEVDFGPLAEVDLQDRYIRWFDHWLKGVDNGVDCDPAVQYFEMGTNRWRTADRWPPAAAGVAIFYLGAESGSSPAATDGALLEEPGAPGSHGYRYDPRNPVPTLWSERLFTTPADRRVLDSRDDILRFRSPPMARDLHIAGYPEARLFVSTSAPDTDFFARLIDEVPGGMALELCFGVLRLRHRHSLEEEDFLPPGEVAELRIRLGAVACCIREGHRIRLEVTSSDFPNFDRNHNTGGRDLFESELRIADQRVWHGGEQLSRLILPIVGG